MEFFNTCLSKIKLFKLIILLTSVFINLIYSSQHYKPTIEDPLLEKWRWIKFPELSNKGVHCISEDLNQKMWFGLDQGIISYDGSSWTEYTAANGFTNGTVSVLYSNEQGFLYAGSDSGLFAYNQKNWQPVFSARNIPGFLIQSIIEVRNKGIFCATNFGLFFVQDDIITVYTSDTMVSIFKNAGFIVKTVSSKVEVNNTFYISDIYLDKSGSIWLAVGYNNGLSGKLIRLNIPKEPQNDLQFSVIFSEKQESQFYNNAHILQTSSGQLWIINNQHNEGILIHENNRFEKFNLGKKFGNDEITSSILETKDGTLFIGALGILYTLKNGEWKIYRTPNIPLPSSTRLLVFESKDGNLWIAGKQNEVYKFDFSATNWATFRNLNFEAESTSGDQWFTSIDGRIVKHSANKWISYGEEDGLIDAPVRVLVTRNGEVWAAGSHKGIAASAYLENSKWKKQLYPSLSWNIDFRSVIEDKQGGLWFGGNIDIQVSKSQKGGTIYIKDPVKDKSTFVQYLSAQKEPGVYGMGQSGDGKMWLTGIGTCMLDNKTWKTVNEPEELKYHADYMCSTENGYLWIGSRNYGLFHYNGLNWKNYTIEDGLISNSITFILPESESCVLIATDKGISKFDGNSWTNDIFPSELTIEREGGSIRKSLAGEIWINKRSREWTRRVLSSNKKLTPKMKEFWTVFYKPDAQAPETKISIYDKQVYQPGNTIISWEALDPWAKTPIEKLQYSYRIDNGTWSPFSYKTNNIFLSLPAGDHVFEVRARDIDYNIDATPAKIEFNVAPPFYLHPLFYIPMLVLTIIIITLQIRIVIRGRKLRTAKRETDNILNNVEEGIVLIDNKYIIESQYSKIIERILEEEALAHKNFMEILKDKMDEKLWSSTVDFIDIMFRENFDQSMMDELNPISEVKLNFEDKNVIKYLTFNFRNIENDIHEEREVMITVRDITEQTLLEQQLQESREEAKRQMDSLVSILHIDPPMLREFIVSASEELKIVDEILKGKHRDKFNNNLLKEIYRSIHSIKGNASLLAFKAFAEQAHSFEDKISELEKKESLQHRDLKVLKDELKKIKKLLNEVNNLLERIGKIHEQMRPKTRFEHDVLIQTMENLVQQTAADEGKKVSLDASGFKIEEVPHKDRIFIKDIMIQLIRNALAHGIEKPSTRKEQNKKSEATIKINTFTKNGHYGIVVSDDGHGIQLEKIKAKAIKTGRVTEEEIQQWDNNKIISLIFEQGISTKESVNMVAGRGVGLDIVKEKVNARKGDIEIRFEEGKFTEFKISIPK